MPFTDFEGSTRIADINGTEFGGVGLCVAGEKIEDVVLAGIDSGLKRRPGNRRHRGNGRGQRPEGALPAEAVESGKFALVHPLFGKLRVHAVQPQNDAFLDAAASERPAVPDRPEGITQRPRKYRQKARQQGEKDSQERSHHCEPRPGANIRLGRTRDAQQQNQQNYSFIKGSLHVPILMYIWTKLKIENTVQVRINGLAMDAHQHGPNACYSCCIVFVSATSCRLSAAPKAHTGLKFRPKSLPLGHCFEFLSKSGDPACPNTTPP